MPTSPTAEVTLNVNDELLGRTIRSVTAQRNFTRERLAVTIELLRQRGADPSMVEPHDFDRVTVEVFGDSVFKVVDQDVSRLLAEDGSTLQEPPTSSELSRAIRNLIPVILQALEAPCTPPSERPTIPVDGGESTDAGDHGCDNSSRAR